MDPKRLPRERPGTSLGDFLAQKGSAGIKVSALGGLFAPSSAFWCPRARPGPPQATIFNNFGNNFGPPRSILRPETAPKHQQKHSKQQHIKQIKKPQKHNITNQHIKQSENLKKNNS